MEDLTMVAKEAIEMVRTSQSRPAGLRLTVRFGSKTLWGSDAREVKRFKSLPGYAAARGMEDSTCIRIFNVLVTMKVLSFEGSASYLKVNSEQLASLIESGATPVLIPSSKFCILDIDE